MSLGTLSSDTTKAPKLLPLSSSSKFGSVLKHTPFARTSEAVMSGGVPSLDKICSIQLKMTITAERMFLTASLVVRRVPYYPIFTLTIIRSCDFNQISAIYSVSAHAHEESIFMPYLF